MIDIHIDHISFSFDCGGLAALQEQIMALATSTQQKLDALSTQITETGTALAAAASGLAADIASLKAQVGSGSSPDEINAALDGLGTKVAALKASADSLTTLDAETTPVAPPVGEPEV